jgi:hypothetical protein
MDKKKMHHEQNLTRLRRFPFEHSLRLRSFQIFQAEYMAIEAICMFLFDLEEKNSTTQSPSLQSEHEQCPSTTLQQA